MKVLRVLHLIGSAVNDFYGDLSRLYAGECLAATRDPSRYDFHIAYVTPDGRWRFPPSLSQAAIASTPSHSLPEAMQIVSDLAIDVALPQMFCVLGMTHYRTLLDCLGIPYVGNRPDVMALAADKAKAKAIVAAAGVRVPDGEVLTRGEQPRIKPPAIVKPTSSDNSLGVTLVRSEGEFSDALALAFSHADTAIVETYIELGREIRGGAIVRDSQLTALPFEEYRLSASTPIRSYAEKLTRTDRGDLGYAAKGNGQSWIASMDDPIAPAVWEATQRCHDALGCRHYSLFDFRIDPQGRPWFLEAGLYCSFSPNSVLSEMMLAAGVSLPDFFDRALRQVASGDRTRHVGQPASL